MIDKRKLIVKGMVLLWVIVCGLFLWGVISALSQTLGFQAQWDHGGEPDLAGFHLFWKMTGGEYAIGYDLAIADYQAPPEWMLINAALIPGAYQFVVTAYDGQGNESAYSNEATLTVSDTPPSPCQNFSVRLP